MNQFNAINSIPNISGLNQMNLQQNGMSNIMLPDPNVMNNSSMIKMKSGTNNNFNQIFENISKEGLIPVLPEMQQYFDLKQIANMPQKEFSSEIQYGNEPKIMDSGLLNQNYGMKKPLPLINDPSLASMANLNQFGNPMGNFNNMNLGSASIGEFGKNNENATLEKNTENILNINTNNTLSNENVLKGGLKKKKNFFLKKI